MDEHDVRGVRYYSGTKLPPEGTYAVLVKDGNLSCGLYAVVLAVATVAVVVACAVLMAAR